MELRYEWRTHVYISALDPNSLLPVVFELFLLLELIHVRQLHTRLALLHVVELLQHGAVDGAALLLECAQLE